MTRFLGGGGGGKTFLWLIFVKFVWNTFLGLRKSKKANINMILFKVIVSIDVSAYFFPNFSCNVLCGFLSSL